MWVQCRVPVLVGQVQCANILQPGAQKLWRDYPVLQHVMWLVVLHGADVAGGAQLMQESRQQSATAPTTIKSTSGSSGASGDARVSMITARACVPEASCASVKWLAPKSISGKQGGSPSASSIARMPSWPLIGPVAMLTVHPACENFSRWTGVGPGESAALQAVGEG